MKKEEIIVKEFLIYKGYYPIEFEPLGKSKSLDFLINNKIGVEVRRLNQYMNIDGIIEPIEKLEHKIESQFEKILDELNDPKLSFSIAVLLEYKRPLSPTKQFQKELKDSIVLSTQLQNFNANIQFSKNLAYSLFLKEKSDKTYELRGVLDKDRGGAIQDIRYEALKFSINEKSKKLNHLKDEFSELWLILVDDISQRIDKMVRLDLKRYPLINSIFDRIILISKIDKKVWVDLYP